MQTHQDLTKQLASGKLDPTETAYVTSRLKNLDLKISSANKKLQLSIKEVQDISNGTDPEVA